MGRLDGKVAVVTGGARGIGQATAERFFAEGARVAIWDVAFPEGTATGNDFALLERADVRDRKALDAAAAHAAERFGGIDILVNNAGITAPRQPRIGDVSEGEWRTVLDVNLGGTLNATQAVLPYLRKRGGGRIVNLASIFGVVPFPGQTPYAASKAGILALTRTWARELGPQGITVNAVVPGYVDTPMNNPNATQFRQLVVSQTALGRLGEAVDVASVILFLASADAAFVTGAAIPVDGGLYF